VALAGQEANHSSSNSVEKIEYLMKQDDAKFILKWHFGVKLFRAWIDNKNSSAQQRPTPRNDETRRACRVSRVVDRLPLLCRLETSMRVQHVSTCDQDVRAGGKTGHRSDPLLYRADELNNILCLFLKETREMYEGDSIYYLCLGIQHYLRENRPLNCARPTAGQGHFYRTESMFFDATFVQFQCKLHAILSRFCHQREPSRPLTLRGPSSSATMDDRPSRIEEELLWEAKQLGAHTPWVLLNTILYFNTKYFFLKNVSEHQVLSFSNVRRHHKRNVGPHGEEYGRSVYLR
jgi:hypothetical protein